MNADGSGRLFAGAHDAAEILGDFGPFAGGVVGDLEEVGLVDGGHGDGDAAGGFGNQVVEAGAEFLEAGVGALFFGSERDAERLDVGADLGGVGLIDGYGLAVDFDGVAVDGVCNAAEDFGGEFGEGCEFEVSGAELFVPLDDAIGGGAVEAKLGLAEIIPGELVGLKDAAVSEVLEALGLMFGTFVGNHGKRLLPADPGFAGLAVKYGGFHSYLFKLNKT